MFAVHHPVAIWANVVDMYHTITYCGSVQKGRTYQRGRQSMLSQPPEDVGVERLVVLL